MIVPSAIVVIPPELLDPGCVEKEAEVAGLVGGAVRFDLAGDRVLVRHVGQPPALPLGPAERWALALLAAIRLRRAAAEGAGVRR